MGVTNSNKVADASAICCGDIFQSDPRPHRRARYRGRTPRTSCSCSDRSGSLSGAPLADMKAGAKTFIDIISESTGGAGSGEIGSGSRMGVVELRRRRRAWTPRSSTSVADLKAAVDGISAGGGTNHGDAFLKAQGLFEPVVLKRPGHRNVHGRRDHLRPRAGADRRRRPGRRVRSSTA